MFKIEQKMALILDEKDFQNESNNYDQRKPHTISTNIIFKPIDAASVSLDVMTLVTVMKLFNLYSTNGVYGKLIDHMYDFVNKSKAE